MRVGVISWRDLANVRAGGSEVVVDRWASGLQDRGHEVHLLAGGPVQPRGYPVTRSGGTYSQYVRGPLRARTTFRDVDVVLDVSNGIPFFTPLWRRGPVVCVVHHVHRDQWREYFPRPVAALGNALEQQVVPRVYRRAHFVGISASTCQDLGTLGVAADRVHLVENGLEPDCFPASSPDRSATPLFVALGRVARNKDLDLLLDMWAAVRSRAGGELVIAGSGPELDRLRARRVPGVRFTGRVSDADKRALLARAWALVHAAPREGWGLVLLEAAAAGTPSIGFDVPGVRDAVQDGVTGLLAADRADFEDAWVRLALDPVLRRRLGRAADVRARTYTWDRTIDALEAVLLRAAGRSAPVAV